MSVSALIEAMAVDWRDRRDGDDLRAARARRAGSQTPGASTRSDDDGRGPDRRRRTRERRRRDGGRRRRARRHAAQALGRRAARRRRLRPRRRCARWAWSAPPGRCCGSTSATASTARAARGPSPTHRAHARVLRERRQGGRRGGDHARASTPAFFADAPGRRAARRSPTTGSGQQGRLTEPMCLPAGRDHYEPISLGRRVRADRRARCARSTIPTRRSSTPRAAPATRPRSSTSCSCARFGTNNLPDCSNMCHESSGVGAGRDDRRRQGHGHARRLRRTPTLIVVVGQNPGTNHPRMLTALRAGQAQRRAASSRSTRCPRPG